MSWLSDLGGFTKKASKPQKIIANPADNIYLANLIKNMLWNGNLRLDNSSRSFVEDGYAGNIDIYSIVNYVITTASNVRFKVQIKDGGKWIDDDKSELIKLINRPNALTNYSLFIEETLGWKILDGALYVYAPRLENGINKGKTLELWTMPSTNMEVVGGDIMKPIKGFRYNSWENIIPIEDVLYLRYFNPIGAIDNLSESLTGMSPLRAAVMSATRSNSAAMAGVAAFENNGAMGIISKDSGQWADFSDANAKALSDAWKYRNGGADNYNKVVFTDGQIDFKRMNMSPADLRIGELELQSKRQIAASIKVPTQLLNDAEGATFSNQEAAQKSVYENTIIPEMRSLGEGIINWLGESYYGNAEVRMIPDVSEIGVLQKDREKLASWLVNADFMTQNEKRKEMGLGEDESNKNMDDYLIPSSKIFSKDLDMIDDMTGTDAAE